MCSLGWSENPSSPDSASEHGGEYRQYTLVGFLSFISQMRELEWRSWVVCPHHTENRWWRVLGSGMVAPSPGLAQRSSADSLSV